MYLSVKILFIRQKKFKLLLNLIWDILFLQIGLQKKWIKMYFCSNKSFKIKIDWFLRLCTQTKSYFYFGKSLQFFQLLKVRCVNRICLTLKLTVCIFFDYRVYDIEERIKTPRKFRFPQFEPVNWLAAQKLKNDLSDLNSDSTLCPSHLLSGIKALLQALKLWLPDLETKVFSKLLLS